MSHPSWVCGLKLACTLIDIKSIGVTPFVGVWIETVNMMKIERRIYVTPFVGVWIETALRSLDERTAARHTLRGCVD